MTLDDAQQLQPSLDELLQIDLPSTYLAIPLEPLPGLSFQNCAYCKLDWTPVAAADLGYLWKQPNGNFVKIIRPSDSDITAKYKGAGTPDLSRHLFGAIARTRKGDEVLPNVFRATDSCVIIPALFAEGEQGHRSVVLIFWYIDEDGGYTLRSTSDPIIKPDPIKATHG